MRSVGKTHTSNHYIYCLIIVTYVVGKGEWVIQAITNRSVVYFNKITQSTGQVASAD